MMPYQYQPLDESAREIRLLTLHPGLLADEICVSLEIITLPDREESKGSDVDGSRGNDDDSDQRETTDDSKGSKVNYSRRGRDDDSSQRQSTKDNGEAHYEALSYAWGFEENPFNLRIVDKCSEAGTISITQSLAAALPYLRLEYRPRRLWVDAISINQQDLPERSSQVKLMASIFSQAEVVIAWLGVGRSDSHVAFDYFTWLGTNVVIDWDTWTMSSTSREYPGLADGEEILVLDAAIVDAIGNTIDQPWFRRLWIRQEIHLARTALLMCSFLVMDWATFRRAVYCLYLKLKSILGIPKIPIDTFSTSLEHPFRVIHEAKDSGDIGFLLFSMRDCLCKDPRDRFYGLSPLVRKSPGRPWNIEPDYTKSVRYVLEEATFSYMEARGCLDLLQYCEISSHSYIPALPTWVPRWDHLSALPGRLLSGNAECAIRGSFRRERRQDVSVLSCKGLAIGTVQRAFEYRHASGDTIGFAAELHRILSLVKAHLGHDLVSSKQFQASFGRSILGGHFLESWDPPRPSTQGEQVRSATIDKILGGRPSDFNLPGYFDPTECGFLFLASRFSALRAVIIADRGQVGIGPKTLAEKDQLCILLGCNNPLALRSTQDSNSITYQVVGGCYVDSLLAGEAILGPLPDGWSMVYYAADDGYRIAFRETATSATHWDDPRLELLLGDRYEARFQKRSRRTREEEDMMLDEVTKRRGLEWKTFSLV